MTHSIILFDGVCVLCDRAMRFVIQQDKQERFQFATLQSKRAQQLRLNHQLDDRHTDSFVLLSDGHCYTHSTAALHVFRLLGGAWQLLYAFIIVPKGIRDALYRFFAARRYRLFGKKETCFLPGPELKNRFLEEL